jgi:hypothetical protein
MNLEIMIISFELRSENGDEPIALSLPHSLMKPAKQLF